MCERAWSNESFIFVDKHSVCGGAGGGVVSNFRLNRSQFDWGHVVNRE